MGDFVFFAALAVMAVTTLYFAPRIRTARVPMQWGFGGKPTWYAPRLVGLWWSPALAVFVRLLILAAATYTPDKVHHADLGLTLFSVILAILHAVHLMAVARWAANAGRS